MATPSKGHIELLPGSSYRVKVYVGIDPVTGKERRARETCPDETSAAIALGRLLRASRKLGRSRSRVRRKWGKTGCTCTQLPAGRVGALEDFGDDVSGG